MKYLRRVSGLYAPPHAFVRRSTSACCSETGTGFIVWALNSTALAGPSIWIIPAEQLVTIGPRGHPLNGASLAARRGGRLISRTTSLDAPTPVETSCGQLVALRIILLHDQFSRDRMPKIPYSRLLAAKRFKDSSPQPVDFAADAQTQAACRRPSASEPVCAVNFATCRSTLEQHARGRMLGNEA